MKLLKYLLVFVCGFLIAKLIYDKKIEQSSNKEVYQIISNGVNSLSKLVVSQGNFAQVYSFSDSKKYFYDVVSFDKKAVLSVNATVEVGYDLSKMDIQIDSIQKKIIINKIPEEDVTIIPNIKYFDLQESQFNSFSSDELNALNKKAIEKIKNSIQTTSLKQNAKNRLFEELSKIYQLSKIFNWEVVDNTTYQLHKLELE